MTDLRQALAGLTKGQEKSFCREKNCGKMTSHVSGLCEKHRKHWLEGYKYAVSGRKW